MQIKLTHVPLDTFIRGYSLSLPFSFYYTSLGRTKDVRGAEPKIKNPILYYNYSYIDIIPCRKKSYPVRSLVNNIELPDPYLHVLDLTVTPSAGR